MTTQSRPSEIRIGVGAVVFRGDEVLLIRRGKAPFAGLWSIPGGGLQYGESLHDALSREVREETSVEIRVGALIGVFEALPDVTDPPPRAHWVMVDYLAEWTAGEPAAGDDAVAAEFVAFDEALSRLSWDQTRLALQNAKSLRAAANLL